jgi:NTE family protein
MSGGRSLGGVSRIGLVLGGGGVIGNAYITGVLEGLRQATGWDPIAAELTVGTSAGSVNGGLLAAGIPAEFLFAHITGELERALPEPGFAPSESVRRLAQQRDLDWMSRLYPMTEQPARPALASPRSVLRSLTHASRTPLEVLLTGLLPEGRRSTRTIGEVIEMVWSRGWPRSRFWAVASDLESGRRVPFGRSGSPATDLSRAVRASCAIPSFFAPVRVHGRRFVDGGIWSVSNLDLVEHEGLDLVVCVNPLSPSQPRPRRGTDRGSEWLHRLEQRAWGRFARRLAEERTRVEARGTRVLLIQPSAADLEVIPTNWMEAGPRMEVARRALETTVDALARDDARETVALLRGAVG